RVADLHARCLKRSDVSGDVPGVPPHAAHVLRGERVKEVQADEVETRLGRDPALVRRLAVLAEDRHVDPAEVLPEARAPDDVRDVHDTSVLEDGQAVTDADSLRNALDARSEEIVRLNADPRRAAIEDVRADLAADRRLVC